MTDILLRSLWVQPQCSYISVLINQVTNSKTGELLELMNSFENFYPVLKTFTGLYDILQDQTFLTKLRNKLACTADRKDL